MTESTKYNIYVENFAGDIDVMVFNLTIAVLNDSDLPLASLVGASSTFTIKENYYTDAAVVSISSDADSDLLSINPVTGDVSLTLTCGSLGEISHNIAEQTFSYDWDMVDGGGTFIRLIKGDITFGGDL